MSWVKSSHEGPLSGSLGGFSLFSLSCTLRFCHLHYWLIHLASTLCWEHVSTVPTVAVQYPSHHGSCKKKNCFLPKLHVFFFWWCAEWVLSNWTAFMSPIKGVKIRSQTGGLCKAGQMVSKQKKETKHISKHQCLDKQRNKALCIRLRGTKGS